MEFFHPRAGKGKGYAFLQQHMGTQSDDCILWPFSGSDDGYGQVSVAGCSYRAHQLMCQLVHGHPPTRAHEAAHECGNPGCVNPRHLTWKTRRENALDMARHGTAPKNGRRRKLTDEQVRDIRSLKNQKSLRAIAAMFGVKAIMELTNP